MTVPTQEIEKFARFKVATSSIEEEGRAKVHAYTASSNVARPFSFATNVGVVGIADAASTLVSARRFHGGESPIASESGAFYLTVSSQEPNVFEATSEQTGQHGFVVVAIHSPHSGHVEYYAESPFDCIVSLRDDDAKIAALVEGLRKLHNVEFRNELSNRIVELQDIVRDEKPDYTISPDSLRWFIVFLKNAPSLRQPSVVLTETGNFRAVWRTGPTRHFAIEFYPDGIAKFVIFAPGRKRPEEVIRISGSAHVNEVMDVVVPYGVLEWAKA